MKRRLWMGAASIAAIAWLWPDAGIPPKQGHVQAAVLGDGFVVAHTHGAKHHVIEVDPGGRATVDHAFEQASEVRVVGTSAGPTAVFEEGKRIRLVRIQDQRSIAVYGKSVRMMCDGFASNEHRFAVGWVESDDKLWFVHGPTTQSLVAAEMPEMPETSAAPPKEWCVVASAGRKVALSWRERDRLFISTCTPKKCGMAGATKLDANETILALGCVEDACLLASRAKGMARLSLIAPSGAIKWSKRLDANANPLDLTIVGAGKGDFAVGYHDNGYANLLAVNRSGTMHRKLTTASSSTPAVSWNRGTLLFSHARANGIVNETMKFP